MQDRDLSELTVEAESCIAPTPREYTKKLNKKERRIALKSALTSRVQADKS